MLMLSQGWQAVLRDALYLFNLSSSSWRPHHRHRSLALRDHANVRRGLAAHRPDRFAGPHDRGRRTALAERRECRYGQESRPAQAVRPERSYGPHRVRYAPQGAKVRTPVSTYRVCVRRVTAKRPLSRSASAMASRRCRPPSHRSAGMIPDVPVTAGAAFAEAGIAEKVARAEPSQCLAH
jgi:hypothetical protein